MTYSEACFVASFVSEKITDWVSGATPKWWEDNAHLAEAALVAYRRSLNPRVEISTLTTSEIALWLSFDRAMRRIKSIR